MTERVEFTHKGLFCGIVPVYVGNVGDDVLDVKERHWVFVPLFVICEWLLMFVAFLLFIVGRPTEVSPILITGKLSTSRWLIID